jgi:hypothetical protein
VPRDRNPYATEPSHFVRYPPPVVRTNSRSHNSRLALLGLGVMAALVALVSDAQPARPADAAVSDQATSRAITDVDFAAVAQPGVACAQGLEGRPPLLVAVHDSSSQFLDERTYTHLEVDSDVLYGDLDGDGADDAVVHVICHYGANGAQDTVQVWSMTDRGPVVVDRITAAPAAVADDSAFPPRVHGLALDDGELSVTYTRHAEGDPHCCPSQQTEVRFAFSGDDLAPVGDPVSSTFQR